MFTQNNLKAYGNSTITSGLENHEANTRNFQQIDEVIGSSKTFGDKEPAPIEQEGVKTISLVGDKGNAWMTTL